MDYKIPGFKGKVELNGGPVSLPWDELAGDAFKDMAISAAPCGRSLLVHICSCALFWNISSTEQGVLFVESNWIAGNMLLGENQDISMLLYF